MKKISLYIHGILDYTIAALLILSPWLFGFNRSGSETWTPLLLGAFILMYSLITNYQLGAFKELNVKTHLIMDVIVGIYLMVSPWIIGFKDFVFLPHLIMGSTILLLAYCTQTGNTWNAFTPAPQETGK